MELEVVVHRSGTPSLWESPVAVISGRVAVVQPVAYAVRLAMVPAGGWFGASGVGSAVSVSVTTAAAVVHPEFPWRCPGR